MAPWPDNVRGLLACLSRAEVLAGPHITLAALPEPIRRRVQRRGSAPSAPAVGFDRPSRDELAAVLREQGGVVARVARSLGKPRRQIYRWLQYHDLDPDEFRG